MKKVHLIAILIACGTVISLLLLVRTHEHGTIDTPLTKIEDKKKYSKVDWQNIKGKKTNSPSKDITKVSREKEPDYKKLFVDSLKQDVQSNQDLKYLMEMQALYATKTQREFMPVLDGLDSWASSAPSRELVIKRRDFIRQAQQSMKLVSYSKIWTDPDISKISGIDTLEIRKNYAKMAMNIGMAPPEQLWTGQPIPNNFYSECQSKVIASMYEKTAELDPDNRYFNTKSYDLMIGAGLSEILWNSIIELSSPRTKEYLQMSILPKRN